MSLFSLPEFLLSVFMRYSDSADYETIPSSAIFLPVYEEIPDSISFDSKYAFESRKPFISSTFWRVCTLACGDYKLAIANRHQSGWIPLELPLPPPTSSRTWTPLWLYMSSKRILKSVISWRWRNSTYPISTNSCNVRSWLLKIHIIFISCWYSRIRPIP